MPGSVRTRDEVVGVARAGRVLARALRAGVEACRAGVPPVAVSEVVERSIMSQGGRVVLRDEGFPGGASIGVNTGVSHAEPGHRPLRAGDLVVIDSAVGLDGFVADAARAVAVPPASRAALALIEGARAVRLAMLRLLTPGRAWGEVATVAHARAASLGLRIVPGHGGHGLGRRLHEAPSLPLEGSCGVVLEEGMVVTIEPVVGLVGQRVNEAEGAALECFEEWGVVVEASGVRILCG